MYGIIMMLMLISKALPKITVILGKEKTFIVEQSRQLKQTSSMFSSLLFHMKKKKTLKKNTFLWLDHLFFLFFFLKRHLAGEKCKRGANWGPPSENRADIASPSNREKGGEGERLLSDDISPLKPSPPAPC